LRLNQRCEWPLKMIPTMTSAMYRQAIDRVRAPLKAAPGFVAHAGTPCGR